VTSKQVENYFSLNSQKDFSKIFDQYLRTTKIPVLEYKQAGNTIQYRWTNVVSGFIMPVQLTDGQWITPSTSWKMFKLGADKHFSINHNFYITVKKV